MDTRTGQDLIESDGAILVTLKHALDDAETKAALYHSPEVRALVCEVLEVLPLLATMGHGNRTLMWCAGLLMVIKSTRHDYQSRVETGKKAIEDLMQSDWNEWASDDLPVFESLRTKLLLANQIHPEEAQNLVDLLAALGEPFQGQPGRQRASDVRKKPNKFTFPSQGS